MIKTENQIFRDMFSLINQFIASRNLGTWNVQQLDQPTQQGLKTPTLYLTNLNSKRYGWQARHNKSVVEDGVRVEKHIESYFEEILFQCTAFKKRNIADENELTSWDILNRLITFLQSDDGRAKLKDFGYQTFRIINSRNPAFETDSKLFEKMPSFDFTIVLEQTEESIISGTTKLKSTIKRI